MKMIQLWLLLTASTKRFHFIAYKKTYDVQNVALLFHKEIIRLHDIPLNFTSNRDVKFISHFWHELWRRLQTDLCMSLSYHPQTYEQTKVVNLTLNSMSQCITDDNPSKWEDILSQPKFA